MSNWELNRELKEMNKEHDLFMQELSNQRQYMAKMLLNDMGKDMNDVLNGKTKVKMSFWLKLKYKVNYYINKLFNAI